MAKETGPGRHPLTERSEEMNSRTETTESTEASNYLDASEMDELCGDDHFDHEDLFVMSDEEFESLDIDFTDDSSELDGDFYEDSYDEWDDGRYDESDLDM